jgi:hypothetical protein
MAMAHLEGRPLSKFIRTGQHLPPRAVVAVVRQLALAMQEAHIRGVIHRDLKPSNIMITPSRQPVIMDFGLARRTDAEDTKLTKSGLVVGTPAYMPPEQLNGDQELIGPITDVYALGVILYELLAGRPPFVGPLGGLMAQIMIDPPPPLGKWRPDLDPALDRVCGRALAKLPKDRYPSMAALAVALDDYLRAPPRPVSATTTPAVPPQPPPPAARPSAPLDEENAATLFNEMAAQQVRLGVTPRPHTTTTHRRHHRRRRRTPGWLAPLALSVAALAIGGSMLFGLAQWISHARRPAVKSTEQTSTRTPEPGDENDDAAPTVDNARKAVRLLRRDGANPVGRRVVKNWLALRSSEQPELPRDVRADFAKAVILIIGEWDGGRSLLPLDDLPLWREAVRVETATPWTEAAINAGRQVHCGDVWWQVADDEQRAGWPVDVLRRRACKLYQLALPYINPPDVRARVTARINEHPER